MEEQTNTDALNIALRAISTAETRREAHCIRKNTSIWCTIDNGIGAHRAHHRQVFGGTSWLRSV
ncbi:hypothetical protein ACN08X_06425 [Rothia sp. P6271]|uniref:hypothetical protein n=1 Tax=unclassified Rothia (in: high G+C Gram-positive bacteria) TaxID=2689056 RepID=UPI003AC72D6F